MTLELTEAPPGTYRFQIYKRDQDRWTVDVLIDGAREFTINAETFEIAQGYVQGALSNGWFLAYPTAHRTNRLLGIR